MQVVESLVLMLQNILYKFAKKNNIPVALTLMGLGAFPVMMNYVLEC